jgi:hypothetical protein
MSSKQPERPFAKDERPAVKSESEFIEVVIKMPALDAAFSSADQLPLQRADILEG